MNCCIRLALFAIITIGPVAQANAATTAAPEGVSPGAVDRYSTIPNDCPAFSWEMVAVAEFYELVAYQLPEDQQFSVDATIGLSETQEVLYVRVPGGATSWTPELEQCLTPGGRYVWFVRAVFEEVDGVVLDAGEWSEGLFFSVAAEPTAVELREAIDVIRRYLEEEGGTDSLESLLLASPEIPSTIQGHRKPQERAPAKLMPAGTAAIRGEMPDPVGETYGVWGITRSDTDGSTGVLGYADAITGQVYGVGGTTDSPDGAGVVAFNSTDGPDVELMSSAGAGAYLTESGIDRPWPTSQTFAITNSGGGDITLEVDGVEVVTTDTDQNTLGDLSCAADELAKWNGSSWECAADEDTAPRAAGNQLILSGNALDVVEGPGSGLDADLLDGHDSTWFANISHVHDGRYYTQTNLNNSGAGGAVHWDNLTSVPAGFADGVDDDTTYNFGPGLMVDNGQIVIDPEAFLLRVSVLDSTGDVGQYSSVAIGADGLGLISYYDVTNGDLKVAHCDDLPCTSATISTLDSTGDVGQYTSVAIGADDRGLISYYDATGGNLRVAHCHNVTCTSGTVSTIDSAGDVGQHTSVAIGEDGLGLISYTHGAPGDLRVAHCANVTCTSAAINTLDYSVEYTSVATGADGRGLIAYHRESDGVLRVAHCNNTACSSAALSALDGTSIPFDRPVGMYCSLAIGADGFGLISYIDDADRVAVAHCTDAACTGPLAEFVTVDGSVPTDAWTSIAVGDDGRALVSYLGSSVGELKVARCNDTRCTSVTPNDLFRGGGSIVPGSVAIGADGRGLVTYYEYGYFGGFLKVARLPLGL